MITPPTIYRGPPGPQAVAPFVVLVIHALRPFVADPVRRALSDWVGSDVNLVSTWPSLAKELHFTTELGHPYCTPTFAAAKDYRWGALVVEAQTEAHLYVGLRTDDGSALPTAGAVTERAAGLLATLRRTEGWDGTSTVSLQVSAELYIGGEQSGRVYRPPYQLLEVLAKTETLSELAPLFIAIVGGLVTGGTPLLDISLMQVIVGLLVMTGCYLILGLLRWLPHRKAAAWTADDWPVTR